MKTEKPKCSTCGDRLVECKHCGRVSKCSNFPEEYDKVIQGSAKVCPSCGWCNLERKED